MIRIIILTLLTINTYALGFKFSLFKQTVSTRTIVLNGSFRQWSDGTNASTCNAYRNPTTGYLYSGSTGDGVYRITVNGTNYDVYCLMSVNSKGYTQIVQKISNNTGTTQQVAYASGSNFISNLPRSYFNSTTGQVLMKGSLYNSSTYNNTYQAFGYDPSQTSTTYVGFGSFYASFPGPLGSFYTYAPYSQLSFPSTSSTAIMQYYVMTSMISSSDGETNWIIPGGSGIMKYDSNYQPYTDTSMNSSFMSVYYIQ